MIILKIINLKKLRIQNLGKARTSTSLILQLREFKVFLGKSSPFL